VTWQGMADGQSTEEAQAPVALQSITHVPLL
jgi:hypothetical protein